MKLIIINLLFLIGTIQGLRAIVINGKDSVLQNILLRFNSIDSYKCNFDYLTNFGMCLQNYTVILGRNLNDPMYGFNFHIYSDKSKGEDNQFLYNMFYFIEQNNSRIKHLDKNKTSHYDDSIRTLLGNFSDILDYSLFEIEKKLKNKNNTIVKQQDNIINSLPCHHYIIKQKGGTTIDLFIDKQTLHPILIEVVSKNKKGQKNNKFFLYRNTEANPFLQINYFSHKVLFYNQTLCKKYENIQGKTIKSWKLPLLNSNDSLSSTELKGKIVLIEFTAIFCSACRGAINEVMNPLEEKYKNDKNVTIITAFGYEKDNKTDILKYCEKNNIQCKNILYNAGKVEQEFKVKAYPTFFIIDKESKIIYQDIGRLEAFKILDMQINNVNK